MEGNPVKDILDESILKSIAKTVGVPEGFEGYNDDLIMAINSAFMTLHQLGVGPADGFMISGEDADWRDFGADLTQLSGVKNYISLKTRLSFDPPTNSFLVTSIENQLKELEWRLNVDAEGSFQNG